MLQPSRNPLLSIRPAEAQSQVKNRTRTTLLRKAGKRRLGMTRPATIKALHVATLSFNDSNTADLLKLFDAGQIAAVTLICSVFFERQNPKQFRMMADGLAERGQTMALRSHAKIICMA